MVDSLMCADGAILPKSIRNIPDAADYLRQILNPKRDTPLNSLENLFAEIEAGNKIILSRQK